MKDVDRIAEDCRGLLLLKLAKKLDPRESGHPLPQVQPVRHPNNEIAADGYVLLIANFRDRRVVDSVNRWLDPPEVAKLNTPDIVSIHPSLEINQPLAPVE